MAKSKVTSKNEDAFSPETQSDVLYELMRPYINKGQILKAYELMTPPGEKVELVDQWLADKILMSASHIDHVAEKLKATEDQKNRLLKAAGVIKNVSTTLVASESFTGKITSKPGIGKIAPRQKPELELKSWFTTALTSAGIDPENVSVSERSLVTGRFNGNKTDELATIAEHSDHGFSIQRTGITGTVVDITVNQLPNTDIMSDLVASWNDTFKREGVDAKIGYVVTSHSDSHHHIGLRFAGTPAQVLARTQGLSEGTSMEAVPPRG